VWWVGSSVTDVYLGTRMVALCQPGRRTLSEAVPDFGQALVVAKRWLERKAPRTRVRVWLSGGLCRPFLVDPLPGVRNAQEAETVVAALAPQRTGLEGTCTVWLEGKHAGLQRVAAAVSSGTLEQILAAFRGAGRRVASIRPWWASALHSVLMNRDQTPSALGVLDCDSVTLLMGTGGEFEMAMSLAPIVDVDSARSALRRAMMGSKAQPASGAVVRLSIDAGVMGAGKGDIAFGHTIEGV